MDSQTPEGLHGTVRARPARPRSRLRRLRPVLWLVLALVVLVVVVRLLVPSGQPAPQGRRGGMANGPMPVAAATADSGDINIKLRALGTVTPLATVTVRTQINGQLMQLGFQEGQLVKAGDFLAQVDPRPYQLQLEQAQGQLAHDQALLKNALVDLARYKTLVAQDSIAHQQLDTQQALVLQYQGTVATDQANVDNAKLNLVYCHITAPVGGRVGLRQVDQGNYIQLGDTNGIVVITQLQPITVVFTLPEDNLPAIQRRLHAGATLPVTAYDRSNTTKLADGKLLTLDNQIDVTTGTVKLKAEFENQDEQLFPNQFVNAELLVDTLHDQIVVPSSAVQHGSVGDFVYRINADQTVSVQTVKLGQTDGSRVAITAGLAVGDRVVTDGADRLREGATVTIPQATGTPGSGAGYPPGGQGQPPDGAPAQPPQGDQTPSPDGQQPHHRHRPPQAPPQ